MMRPGRVILLLLDGLRADALDAHPVFEELRRRGLFCPRMVTYAPYTTASMHALLTGIYGPRNGVDSYFNAARFRADCCITLPEYFRRAGFSTLVDINNRKTIPCQGYERVQEYDEFHPDNRRRLFDRHAALLDELKRANRPYFAALHNLKTHAELILKFKERFPGEKEADYFQDPARNAREYRQYACEMGDYTAALLAGLDRAAFFRDGLLLVLSDHGCSYGELPGERMYGTYLEDYTIKTFCYFVGLGFTPGARQERLLRTVDIVPTVMDLCGFAPDSTALVPDGASFLRGAPEARWGFVETAPLGGSHPSPHTPNYHGVVSETNKLLYHSERDEWSFYHWTQGGWNGRPADTLEAEEWLWKLCASSPRVNRKWLMKVS